MSDEHKMTKQDKLVLGITLAAIFGGVFLLGLIGLIFNLSPLPKHLILRLSLSSIPVIFFLMYLFFQSLYLIF